MTSDPKMRNVDVTGLSVEMWTDGNGPPLLFLHPGDGIGLGTAFLEKLAARYQVLAPSHPGFGRTPLPSHFRTVDDLSYFYLDFIAANRLKDAILVGVSFGAWIAAEIAVKCSHDLSKLVLIDLLGAKFGDRRTQDITDLFVVEPYKQANVIFHDKALHGPDYSNASDDAVIRLARNYELFGLFGWSPLLHNPQLVSRLHRIAIPTLVLWGEFDRVVSVDYGKKFAAAIPNASFKLVKDAGHYPHIEQTDLSVGLIDEFISGQPDRSRR